MFSNRKSVYASEQTLQNYLLPRGNVEFDTVSLEQRLNSLGRRCWLYDFTEHYTGLAWPGGMFLWLSQDKSPADLEVIPSDC